VLVYMAAHLSPELDAHAARDLREMERATLAPGTRVLVQISRNWPRRAQLYEIAGNTAELLPDRVEESGTGTKASLGAFLQYALERDATLRDGDEAPRRYFLVLWGHNYGLGFGRDHGDPLNIREIGEALETFRKARPGGLPLDLLGANSCAMAYAEAAFQLKDTVGYMVASQIAVPFAGWPFETVLGGITSQSTAQEIGKLVVDRYVSAFRAAGTGEFVSMSLLNLAALDGPLPVELKDDDGNVINTVRLSFKEAFGYLTDAIRVMVAGGKPGASDRLAHVRAALLSAGVGEVRPLIDLRDACERVRDVSVDLAVLQPLAPAKTELEAIAEALRAFLEPPDEDEVRSGAPSARLLAAYEKLDDEERGLNGLGVFVPFVTDPADLTRLGLNRTDRQPPNDPVPLRADLTAGRDVYQQLALVAGTGWDGLVYDTLRAGVPDDVVSNVDVSGATGRAQRGEVTQMLVAVDSLFDVLDRRIDTVHRRVHDAIPRTPTPGTQVLRDPDQFLELQLIRHSDVRKAAQPPKKPGGQAAAKPRPVDDTVELAIQAFVGLERTLGNLERSIARTLTNGTYGLGPGPGGSAAMAPFGKGSGHGGDKGSGHGAPFDDKGSGHGAPGDDKGSGHGSSIENIVTSLALTAVTATPAAAVAALFAEVGGALSDLEAATGDAETLLAMAVTSGGAVVNGGPPNSMQIGRAFRILVDASTQARRTLRRVLANPVYGFGPGSTDVTVEDRRELARVGGLSSMELRLL
jgi:hypothetical protein